VYLNLADNSAPGATSIHSLVFLDKARARKQYGHHDISRPIADIIIIDYIFINV